MINKYIYDRQRTSMSSVMVICSCSMACMNCTLIMVDMFPVLVALHMIETAALIMTRTLATDNLQLNNLNYNRWGCSVCIIRIVTFGLYMTGRWCRLHFWGTVMVTVV